MRFPHGTTWNIAEGNETRTASDRLSPTIAHITTAEVRMKWKNEKMMNDPWRNGVFGKC
jgi:hypothetical protein